MTRAARPSLHLKKMNGKLIVFEGIDGTGKSTQARLLARELMKRGYDVINDYEPTRGPWGMKVRNAAATGNRLPIEEEVEALLNDRKDHADLLIAPALRSGKVVVLDRYYLSMMAYQGASGADVNEIRRRNEEIAPVPDIVFLLELPVETALERIGIRGNGQDAFENRAFLQRASEIYSAMDMPFIHRIDATGDAEEVHKKVLMFLNMESGKGEL